MQNLVRCDVRDATHVQVDGVIEEIASKWGIDAEGHLARPSAGGFGVVTKDGRHIGMLTAQSYWRAP